MREEESCVREGEKQGGGPGGPDERRSNMSRTCTVPAMLYYK